MSFVVWIHSLALLVLNLSLLAFLKLKWPDSSVGKVISVIA